MQGNTSVSLDYEKIQQDAAWDALKVYKEFERILKMTTIKMSVYKVLNMAKSITTIKVYLPKNKEHITRTMIMKRHQIIKQLFDENFWGMH